jgi:hypothetical protein
MDPVLKHPHSMLLPFFERPSFTPMKQIGRITALYILAFTFLDSNRENKRLWIKW